MACGSDVGDREPEKQLTALRSWEAARGKDLARSWVMKANFHFSQEESKLLDFFFFSFLTLCLLLIDCAGSWLLSLAVDVKII